jgi:hypothetical protein
MSNKVCVIHQPNFLPWLGYFQRLVQCDIFILLDDAQYQKKGSNYESRVQFNFDGQAKWVSVPLFRPSGVQKTKELEINSTNWQKKLINTLQTNYGKAPFFVELKEYIFNIINFETKNLYEFNHNALLKLCELLDINIEKKIIYSSSFDLQTTSTQRLIDLCKKVGATIYLSGTGGKLYQDEKLYQQNNIKLEYQKFNHPVYQQISAEFISGLSILDVLFCVGVDKTKIFINE